MSFKNKVTTGFALIAGIGYGAGMMYLLDPDMGRRRRSLIRDQIEHARNGLRRNLEAQVRNGFNHVQGSLAEWWAQAREREISDDVLQQRVRAQLGHVVSHPGSLDVLCEQGHVTVRGPVLAGERSRIQRRLQRTRGVHSCRLEVREQQTAGSIPEPQGESRQQRTLRMG